MPADQRPAALPAVEGDRQVVLAVGLEELQVDPLERLLQPFDLDPQFLAVLPRRVAHRRDDAVAAVILLFLAVPGTEDDVEAPVLSELEKHPSGTGLIPQLGVPLPLEPF